MFFVKMYKYMQDPREEVIQAWYMDDSDEDQRLPHHKDPKEFVSLDQLSGKHFCKRAYGLDEMVKLLVGNILWPCRTWGTQLAIRC